MPSLNDIRSTFLDFFRQNGHQVVASGPLVPRNDPSLMFTNAGMVQFKNVFTGAETRPYRRATTAQKCVRAGGKHNDLENVGHTARHLTFFEMLGNFSFGDYFKELAIELAWTLVTREFGLDRKRLWITIHPTDDKARELWRKIAGLGDERIIGHTDNLWQMGETGPCGFCSEIFYDQGEAVFGGPPGSANEDGDRFLEFYNLVFMQFDQVSRTERVPLPKPSIDTGMGAERISAILQGRHDVFDVDLLRSLIEASAHATGTEPDGPHKVAHRVIADHLRSSAFLIADGVTPSNEGRGYVLRRIMRRAMRHAHIAGAREPVMWRLVPTLVAQMGSAYPELIRAEAMITESLRLEETRFKATLDRGLALLNQVSASVPAGGMISGDAAFQLHDTYGFPLDLTADVLRAEGKSVNVAEFDAAMERQRQLARRNWAGSGEAATERLWFELKDQVGATEFLGYESERAEGMVRALVRDGASVADAGEGDRIALIVNQTPFYAESGGQVGDAGIGETPDGAAIRIEDTQKKLGELWLHQGIVTRGRIRVGDAVDLQVDGTRRRAIRANHSATHLLHAALRRQLGEHVVQKGSLVAPDRLRFDISQPRPVTHDELVAVEAEINARVRENAEVTTRLMAPEQAIEDGAMALFGEKYGDTVRVVSMGLDGNRAYSLELCGGTHVARTGDIGLIRIVGEGAVAAGIRRIEALTGAAALEHDRRQEDLLADAAAAIKATAAELPARVASLAEERRRLEREVAELKRKLATGGGAANGVALQEIGGIRFDGRVLDGVSPKDLKPLADELKKALQSGIVALIAVNDGKASIVVGVTGDLIGRFDAVALARTGAEALGGKGGGGRPDLAQAGGPDGTRAADGLAAIARAIG